MKTVKIVEQGWDKFNGNLGGVDFIDGVSERPLNDIEINRLSAGLRIEDVDSGNQLGVGANLVEARFTASVESSSLNTQDSEPEQVAKKQSLYTREQLEQIADKGGIVELRKIADSLGVKGKSIQTLIEAILQE